VLGDAALFFALGWAATGIGAHVAALVLTGFTLPRAVLLLLGGVLGDRVGPRRLLLVCTAIVGTCCFLLALAVGMRGVSAGLLLTTSVVVGTVDAFALPAAGVLPRLFVPDDQLPRAMALRTSATQLVTLAGGPLSGLLVATVGLVGALTLDGLTFAVQFTVLLALRPPYDVTRPRTRLIPPRRGPAKAAPGGGPAEAAPVGGLAGAVPGREPVGVVPGGGSVGAVAQLDRPSVVRDAVDGLRVAVGDPVLRMILAVVALVAAFVLPVTSLCVPLLARSHAWTAGQAGLVVAGNVAGGLIVTILVARFGTFTRVELTAALGCLLAAVGIAALALAPTVGAAVAGTLTQGIGIGLFTSHLAPLFVRSTPKSHLTRLQSLLSLAQTVPLIATTNLLATLDVHQALAAAAAATTLAGLMLLRIWRRKTNRLTLAPWLTRSRFARTPRRSMRLRS
jgi:MFS family permease